MDQAVLDSERFDGFVFLTAEAQDANRIQRRLCIEIQSKRSGGDEAVRFDLCPPWKAGAGSGGCQSRGVWSDSSFPGRTVVSASVCARGNGNSFRRKASR